MHDPFRNGRELALRVVRAQVVCGLLLAILCWPWFGWRAMLGVAVGAFIIAVGTSVQGYWQFKGGMSSVADMARKMYRAVAWRWFWTISALLVAIVSQQIPFLPLLAGLVVAQAVHWWALVWVR